MNRAVLGERRLVPKTFHQITRPELVFGIAGPIGIKIDDLCESLAEALKIVDYQSHLIKITDEISSVSSAIKKNRSNSFYEQMKYKMDHASSICREADDPGRLMQYAIRAIRREREASDAPRLPLVELEPVLDPAKITAKYMETEEEDRVLTVRHKVAYIIRQIKRPQEINFLRSVYGRQFVLISAYGSEEDRRKLLEERLRLSMPVSASDQKIFSQVEDLLCRDMHEGDDKFGQHLRDSYHHADVFVDGTDKAKMDHGITRFTRAFFGATDVAPTKDEFGLYLASTASMRSSDLSRQVGAAILTSEGELVSQGCNEVPKAFGGTYWDEEQPDHRDVKVGADPNDQRKEEVLRDLLERLNDAGLLAEKAGALAPDIHSLAKLLTNKEVTEEGQGALRDAVILDITEYGRVVHAEMNAICEASRLGHAVKNGILFCTTFPCHNCTKHILSAGISRVVYLEPYPKSRAKDLHKNEISIEVESNDKVVFAPFMGIAPNRFRYIFRKGKRKDDAGKAKRWMGDHGPSPMVDVPIPLYVLFEEAAIRDL